MPWVLEDGIDFLNHGSFGATPTPVLEAQRAIRDQMEAQPVRFFQRELEDLSDAALEQLATFLGCSSDDLAFVTNATAGINAVLRSLALAPDDELLVTDHAYPACRNVLDFVAKRSGASVVVAEVPFPLDDPTQVVAAIATAVTPRTRLALIDHVTSPTGLIFPISDIVAALSDKGVDCLVDGAHAPGMVPLDIAAIGAAYYAGNCHKWLCAPKGAGFLWVRPDRQADVVPVVVSNGASSARSDRSQFRLLFDWEGTDDPSAALTVPAAIDFLGHLHPDGWSGLMAANHAMALDARRYLTAALGISPPAPDDMVGSMVAVPLPASTNDLVAERDPLQALLYEAGFEVPIVPWPAWPSRLLRASAQRYNNPDQYRRLADSLVELL